MIEYNSIYILLILLLSFDIICALSLNNNNNHHNHLKLSSDFKFKEANGFSITSADLCLHLNASPVKKILDNLLQEESLSIVLENLRANDQIIDGLWITGYHLSSPAFKNSTAHLLELSTIPSIDAIVRLPIKAEQENTQEFMEYNHVIYPRRLCHRLLTVRDKICEELIEDLRFIINENEDIKKSGLSRSFISEKKIIPIDEDYQHSTIFRKNNFKKLNQVITNEVISLVRNKLKSNPQQLAYLDDHINKNYDYNLYLQDESVSLNEISSDHLKLLSAAILGEGETLTSTVKSFAPVERTPQKFLNSLYAEGERRGVERQSDGSFINKLKIARDILDLRESISEYLVHVLDKEQRAILKSFRSIKDAGGLKLDDREEITPVFKKTDINFNQATSFIEDGFDFGLARSAASKIVINNSDGECSCEFFPCPEDKVDNGANNQSVQPDEQFGFQSWYGDVMLM